MVTANRAIVAARAARQATLAANADSARRNKLNLENLATLVAAMGKAAAVDEWLANKIAPLLEQGAKRRDEQCRKVGAALLEIHARGERIHDTARLAGIAENEVSELIRMAMRVRRPEARFRLRRSDKLGRLWRLNPSVPAQGGGDWAADVVIDRDRRMRRMVGGRWRMPAAHWCSMSSACR